MRKILYSILISLILAAPVYGVQKEYGCFVIQEIGAYVSAIWEQAYPDCVDPGNCTAQELEDQAEWQVNYDNFIGIKAKAQKAEGWLVDGIWTDIVNETKGVRVRIFAGGKWNYGRAIWFPLIRLLKPDPTTWFDTKIAVMKANGWLLRGWATDDPYIELTVTHDYEYVGD